MNPAFQDIEIKSTQLPSKKARSHCTHLFAIVLSSRGCSITPSQPCQDGHGRSFKFLESFYALPKRNTRIDMFNSFNPKKTPWVHCTSATSTRWWSNRPESHGAASQVCKSLFGTLPAQNLMLFWWSCRWSSGPELILNCLDLVSKKVGQLLSYFNSFFSPQQDRQDRRSREAPGWNHWLNITVISSRLLSFKPTKGVEIQAPTPT